MFDYLTYSLGNSSFNGIKSSLSETKKKKCKSQHTEILLSRKKSNWKSTYRNMYEYNRKPESHYFLKCLQSCEEGIEKLKQEDFWWNCWYERGK